jgi:hypothetical protein
MSEQGWQQLNLERASVRRRWAILQTTEQVGQPIDVAVPLNLSNAGGAKKGPVP